MLAIFSSFILSRTGTWSVRDKIKLEKHGSSRAAVLAKMNPIAAAETHTASTDFAKISKLHFLTLILSSTDHVPVLDKIKVKKTSTGRGRNGAVDDALSSAH